MNYVEQLITPAKEVKNNDGNVSEAHYVASEVASLR